MSTTLVAGIDGSVTGAAALPRAARQAEDAIDRSSACTSTADQAMRSADR